MVRAEGTSVFVGHRSCVGIWKLCPSDDLGS